MRKLTLAIAIALMASVQLAASVRAEDTTVIRKDHPDSTTTVIKKHDEGTAVIRAPSADKKVIIHKDSDD